MVFCVRQCRLGLPRAVACYASWKSVELDLASGLEDDEARNNEQTSVMSVEEIRQRVVELEECSSMWQEIDRLRRDQIKKILASPAWMSGWHRERNL